MPLIVRAADLPMSPWPNGAGRKADIARGADWLVAFAWLDTAAPFSDYTGWDRTITLIDGAEFVLRFGDGAEAVVAPLMPFGFDGGRPVRCVLPHGPRRVLNVMTARATARHAVRIGPAQPDAAVLVALDPVTLADGVTLDRWDALLGAAPGEAGTGRFASIRIDFAAGESCLDDSPACSTWTPRTEQTAQE